MSRDRLLPEPFAELEPLAAVGWCLATEGERVEKRHASTAEELRGFYHRFAPHLERAIAYLDTQGSETWNEADQNLLNLLLAMAEVSFAVEKFGADESSYRGIAAHRFVPVHELEDGGLPIPDAYR